MPSILNGLFAGRSGLSSHGTAISVVSDNIANASTTGYKTSRAEFADLVAGGQAAGTIIGSGSKLAGVTAVQEQGTLEFTSRGLDLAIDGEGYFVVAQGANRFYTRAGNFGRDEGGILVNQDGFAVLGYPVGGSGALEPLNLNTVSQSSVSTGNLTISGNVDASSATISSASIPTVTLAGAASPSTTTYAQLSAVAEFSTVVTVFDSLGASHDITFFYFHTQSTTPQWTVRGYVNSEDVDTATPPPTGIPRQITTGTTGTVTTGTFNMGFTTNGTRVTSGTGSLPTNGVDLAASIPWNNGSSAGAINIAMDPFTQFSSASNILSISQDGQGVGAVTKVDIQKNGDVFAILDNGQSSLIGTIGLAIFSNPDGLTRLGNNLLQKTPASGEPIYGEAQTGKFGTIQAGTLELSTVDIANEFVKLITLQRAFQANSRIITTISSLLNDIIQLA